MVTRFYRALEVMLSSHEYTNAIDVWSIGCTVSEIISGKVLFHGENYIDQVNLIIEKIGTPNESVMNSISNQNARAYIESLPARDKTPLVDIVGADKEEKPSLECMELLEKMLDLDPKTRITVEEAIEHPYFETLHDPEEEPKFEGSIDFSFESDSNLTLHDIKKLILKEITFYNESYADF